MRLKRSFPENTVDGAAINCSVSEVPLSSSLTNTLDKPDIEVKKIITQNKPPVRLELILSLPIEKSIMLKVTIMNIAKALIA